MGMTMMTRGVARFSKGLIPLNSLTLFLKSSILALTIVTSTLLFLAGFVVHSNLKGYIMLVNQIIDLAASSELRQLAVRTDADAVIGFINLGMLELHKRFTLKSEEAIITLQDGKTLYTLDGIDPDVDITNAENFLIAIECYDESGEVVPVNDDNEPLGIMTPSYNTIEVPNVTEGERLSIIYRSSVPFATSTVDNIVLPPQLLESLLHYIGYRGNSTVSADSKAENNTHYTRFEQSCKRVLDSGLIVADDMQSYKFDLKGFV
jgi:hypothetical protein